MYKYRKNYVVNVWQVNCCLSTAYLHLVETETCSGVVCRRTGLTHHFLIVGVHVISQIMLHGERSRALWRKMGYG